MNSVLMGVMRRGFGGGDFWVVYHEVAVVGDLGARVSRVFYPLFLNLFGFVGLLMCLRTWSKSL